MAIEEGIARGRLSDPKRAASLLRDICQALGVKAGDSQLPGAVSSNREPAWKPSR